MGYFAILNPTFGIAHRNLQNLPYAEMGKMKKLEILKNKLTQKAQQCFINIASIFELNLDPKDQLLHFQLWRLVSSKII